MKLKIIKNKKAAIELSIGTIVVIVLAMTMLILGLVLVRSIFTGATDSVDILNEQVKGEITNLFTEEKADIGIKAGSSRLVNVKEGSGKFGVAFGARNPAGDAFDNTATSVIQYEVELSEQGSTCNLNTAKNWFTDPRIEQTGSKYKSSKINFLDGQGDSAYAIIFFDVPDGTSKCSLKVKVATYHRGGGPITTASFTIDVISGGIFS